MKLSGKLLLMAALGASCLPAFADSITTSVTQSGTNEALSGAGSSVVFTSGNGFDFTGTDYLTLSDIDTARLNVTIDDGDSAPGDFDFNNLTLTLDGIDTGLLLNGFPDGQNVQLTLTGPINNSAAVLAALKADGRLVGGIKTTFPNDDNIFFFPTIATTLTLTGPVGVSVVPEPGAMASAAVLFGGLALGLLKGRRKR